MILQIKNKITTESRPEEDFLKRRSFSVGKIHAQKLSILWAHTRYEDAVHAEEKRTGTKVG